MKLHWIIILAVVVRIILMPISYHSDIQHFDLAGYVLQNGAGLGFYDYTAKQDIGSDIRKTYPVDVFNYPPTVYFVLGSIDALMSNLTSGDVRQAFLFDITKILGDWRLNLHIFYLKLIYVPFDIGVGWLLWRMVEKRNKIQVLVLWLFNPVLLYGVYMMGQFDILPVFFSLMAVYLVFNKEKTDHNLWWAAVFLGIGAAFKIYPLLLLPVLGSFTTLWWRRLIILVLGIGVYGLSISLFLTSQGFRSTALIAGQTMKSLYAQIQLSGGESVMLYISALVVVYLWFWAKDSNPKLFANRALVVLMIFFMFTHYHPQWLLWAVPFMVLNTVNISIRPYLAQLVIYACWFGSLWFFDSGLTVGLFAPIITSLYNGPTIWQLIGYNLDINFARSIIASVFFGAGGYLIILNLRKEFEK